MSPASPIAGVVGCHDFGRLFGSFGEVYGKPLEWKAQVELGLETGMRGVGARRCRALHGERIRLVGANED